MKKFVVSVFVIVLGLALIPDAQAGSGVYIGYNRTGFTNANTEDLAASGDIEGLAGSEDEKRRNGISVGLFTRPNSESLFGMRADLLFSTKGSRYDYAADNVTFDTRNSYIELHLLPQLQFPLDALRPNVFVGPYLGYLVNSELEVTTPIGSETYDREDFSTWDYGITFGGGLAVQQEEYTILFDLRYSIGLKNILDADVWGDADLKNQVFTVGVGVGI